MTFMVRAIVIAVLALFLASTSAPAQSDKVCSGRFERLLAGYFIGHEELTYFLADDLASGACLKELDLANPDHQIIAAYISEQRRNQDLTTASRLFASACAQGRKLGCFYAASYAPGTANFTTPAGNFTQASPLLEADLPVVKTSLAVMLLIGADGVPQDVARGKRLLQLASERGDHWAAFMLAEQARRERNVAAMKEWTYKSAEQGNVIMMTGTGATLALAGNDAEAMKWSLMAANADTRFFRPLIAQARYGLGLTFNSGVGAPRDPAEARRWFEAAAALGSDKAREELQRMDGQARPRSQISTATLDVVFAQTPRIAKFDRQPVIIYVRSPDAAPAGHVAAALRKTTEAINAATGLSLHVSEQAEHHAS